MLKTKFGAFDGNSWEGLCQQVFKKKYAQDGYQHIPASPGDFGLEGFCTVTGLSFQCYCPNADYTRKELYGHQRDKITADLGKLKTYQAEIGKIVGGTKLTSWRFVTPEIGHNDLLAHARNKEKEVRSWGLSFLAPDFSIHLHDGDYYIVEINEILTAIGQGLDFEGGPPSLSKLEESPEVYEENVLRKCKTRLAAKSGSPKYEGLVTQLHQFTLKNFLTSDGYLREIEKSAPVLFYKLIRLINAFEHYVQETALTWSGSPEDLTNTLRQDLERRLTNLGPDVTDATAATVARHMIARWLAICALDYD